MRKGKGGGAKQRWDVISLVEAAYDLASDDRTWLLRLLERAAPRLDRGFGITISTYSPGLPPDESLVETLGMSPAVRNAMLTLARAHPESFEAANTPRGFGRCVTFNQTLGLNPVAALRSPIFVEHMHALGVKDFFGVASLDPSGHAIWFGAAKADTRRATRQESAMWSRVTAHVSAGARLRRTLGRAPSPDLSVGSDAVLSSSGAIEHAEPGAKSRAAREWLRNAAVAMDRARTKVRANEDEALDLWKGLVAGRWSLVERFDHGGRRFLVAHRNEPQTTDPRGLMLREWQVLAYMAAGDSLKITAYTLGISTTSIFRHRATAMRKLRLRGPADVVRLFNRAR